MSEGKKDEVGYRVPPKETQFRKGQSGNPKGRPKGSLNMKSVLERTLRERVVVIENGRRKTITKLQAAVTQLANKAASGDLKALQLLSPLVRYAEERPVIAEPSSSVSDEVDEKVVFGILERLGRSNNDLRETKNEAIDK